MAAGIINLQKASGGITKISSADGTGITEVVLPESGELATKEYVDTGAGAAFVANDSRVKTALNAGGTAPIYANRAWCNFNGTGTISIRGSGNISSITDNGAGIYHPNFITAMPDINYEAVGSCSYVTTNSHLGALQMFSTAVNNSVTPSITGFDLITVHTGNFVLQDSPYILFSVRR